MQDASCQLFAIVEDRTEDLVRRPAVVMGEALLAGAPVCVLPDSWRAVEEMITDPLENPKSKASWVRVTAKASYLPAGQVRHLAAFLGRWTTDRLYRNFERRLLANVYLDADMESLQPHPSMWAIGEDWSIDEAEDFERWAGLIDALKQFASDAARNDQALVRIDIC